MGKADTKYRLSVMIEADDRDTAIRELQKLIATELMTYTQNNVMMGNYVVNCRARYGFTEQGLLSHAKWHLRVEAGLEKERLREEAAMLQEELRSSRGELGRGLDRCDACYSPDCNGECMGDGVPEGE